MGKDSPLLKKILFSKKVPQKKFSKKILFSKKNVPRKKISFLKKTSSIKKFPSLFAPKFNALTQAIFNCVNFNANFEKLS